MNSLRPVSSRREQRGAIAIIVALSLAVLIGFAGLALDGGHLYLTKTELQNAADACALSASYELTGAPNIASTSYTNASNAGTRAAAANRVGFQRTAIAAQNVTIEFGPSLSTGPWLSAAANPPGNSKYVRCTVQETGIVPWFMQVLGFGPQQVGALATATLANAQSNCAIPLGMCTQGPAPTYGLTKGQWVNGRFDSGGGLTGSFNWIDFDSGGGGTKDIAELLYGNGQCNLDITVKVGKPGSLGNAAAKAWNSRFGLYQSGSVNLTTAPPDRTGYAYTAKNWPQQSNALPDFRTQRTVNSPYGPNVKQGNTLTGLSLSNAYNPVTTVDQHRQYGADRRLVVAPLVNCNEWATSQQIQLQGWACVLMLHPIASPSDIVTMEYTGLANDPSSPCVTAGVVGSSTSSGPLVPGLVQ
jgi:Flp pilus assembly protein TadG